MLKFAILIAAGGLMIGVWLIFLASSRRRGDDSHAGEGHGTTRKDIQHAIEQLLDATPRGEQGGFVIFHSDRDLDYVQFASDTNGLLLNWPTMQEGGPQRLPLFREQLVRRGFQQISVGSHGPSLPEQISRLTTGQFMILDDGLYAQTGRDASQVRDLTISLLRDIFGITDLGRVTIILELEG